MCSWRQLLIAVWMRLIIVWWCQLSLFVELSDIFLGATLVYSRTEWLAVMVLTDYCFDELASRALDWRQLTILNDISDFRLSPIRELRGMNWWLGGLWSIAACWWCSVRAPTDILSYVSDFLLCLVKAHRGMSWMAFGQFSEWWCSMRLLTL